MAPCDDPRLLAASIDATASFRAHAGVRHRRRVGGRRGRPDRHATVGRLCS